MKKLLTLFSAISIVGSGAVGVVACGHGSNLPLYNPFNFNTWTNKQKSAITKFIAGKVKAFEDSHKGAKWNKWADPPNVSISDYLAAVLNAIDVYNNLIVINFPGGQAFANTGYVTYDVHHNIIPKNSSELLANYIKSGITIVIKGDGFENPGVVELYGSLSITVKEII